MASVETRSGGSLAWRNNNPGNIRYGDFARRNGAVGEGPGGFAIFPDRATGERAITTLLQGSSYRNLSILNAISRYAPPSEKTRANTSATSVRGLVWILTARSQTLARVSYKKSSAQFNAWKVGLPAARAFRAERFVVRVASSYAIE
ncbi:hypothetical protein HC761_01425 [bacterium]|nr:hypothetical protein [bacterium]